MLSVALVVAGLTTGNKIGLAVVGVAFILFALVCSFILPARMPNFPGKNVNLFVGVCVLFFVAMISAVLIFGVEKKEAKAAETPPAATTTAATTTAATPPTAAKGDPVAG